MPIGETLAANLRMLRARSNKSLLQVADEIGSTKSAISRYEQGKRVPTLMTAGKLAECYGVTVDQIIGQDLIATA